MKGSLRRTGSTLGCFNPAFHRLVPTKNPVTLATQLGAAVGAVWPLGKSETRYGSAVCDVWRSWLGREGSNLRMSVPKTDALPLGDAPTAAVFRGALGGVQGVRAKIFIWLSALAWAG